MSTMNFLFLWMMCGAILPKDAQELSRETSQHQENIFPTACFFLFREVWIGGILLGTVEGRTMPSRQFSRYGIGPLRTIHGFGEHSWQSLGSLPSVFSPGWDMFSQESYGDYPRRRNDRRLGISDTMIEAVEGMASFLLGDILTEMAGGLSSESSAVDIRRDQGDSG